MTRFFLLALLLATAPLAHAQRLPVTTASDAARAHYDRGFARLVQNDFPTAALHFDAALAADPGFALAHVYRSAALADGRAEHLRLATAAAARATDGERQLVESYAASVAGDAARQASMLTALATRFPDSPELPLWLSNAERNRENAAASIAAARRALAADASFGPAYNLIGYAEAGQENWPAAEAALREYARLSPDEANPYDSMGEILYNQGRFDEAEAQFRMALTRDAGFTSSRNFLTRIAIERAFEGYVAASNGSDVDAYLAHYTPTAVLSGPRGTETVGREAIRAGAASSMARPHRDVYETIEIVPAGDNHVYHRTRYQSYEGDRLMVDGIDTFLWVKTPEGWKIARDTWTSSVPPSAD